MGSEYEYKPGPAALTLEQQLVYCELAGKRTKAALLRNTIRSIKICKEQEAKDLAKFKEKAP